MSDESIQRDYRMADADLSMFASNLIATVNADIADFAEFGIDAAKMTAFTALCNQFESLPTDNSIIGDVMEASYLRDEQRNLLLDQMHKLAGRVEAKWGADSFQYRKLDFSQPSRLTDNLLAQTGRVMHLQLSGYLTQLSEFGLTQALLDDFLAQIETFEIKKNNQSLVDAMRREKTFERIKMGNEVYEMVVRLCNFGKMLYEKKNPAKYQSFIIYTPSAGGLKPPTNLAYRPGDFVISWSPVENATSYELEYSPDGAAWTVAYSGSDDAVQYIPAVEGWAYFRCRARNSNGYGEFSEVLKAGYYQQIPPPSNVKAKIEEHTENGLLLTWDEVPSATVYKIYTSVVPIGSPSNSFVFLGKPKENNYSCEIERGKRHYFQLTAENSAQWSQRSEAIYLDVE